MQKVYVDFNNCDRQGRVRLNTRGTFDDLERLNIKLVPGLELLLDDDEELAAVGIVQFSEEENIWVATFTWVNT
ncbi:hypothetical protein CLV51_104448 [Chitinophaga niastensis]|uniref:Uncharacterized protein n=2 Tax=Chitinophaga niastensis TaxID=536980 RepID=A0A2P8HHR8_CHINA|nr:hypothetical protein CLV51_104448 [Chitinophaga niastensis]